MAAINGPDPLGVTNGLKKESSSSTTPVKSQGKLESLPKEELIKYVRKQLAVLKQTKGKCEELSSQLEEEKNEVQRLENEKREWLSRGVHAEFEKKDKELEEELSTVVMERDGLQKSLKVLQEEYQSVAKEAKEYKNALETQALQEDRVQEQLQKDNRELLQKIQALQLEKEQTLETLTKFEQENYQLLDKCKELEGNIELLNNDQRSATIENSESLALTEELQAKLAKLMVEKEELMKAVELSSDSCNEKEEQEVKDLKDQIEKLLLERNELQCRFDRLAQEGGAEVRSEPGMGQVIREHFVMENEELKNRNEVRFYVIACTIPTITGLHLRAVIHNVSCYG